MASIIGKIPDDFFRKVNFEEPRLDEKPKLILALRGYTYAVSMLIPSYHFLKAANHAQLKNKVESYPEKIKIHFMQAAMFERLLVQLRRLHETKQSLVENVAEKLSKAETLDFLYQRSNVRIDEKVFIKLFSYVAKEWKLRDIGTGLKCPNTNELISRQNWSAKRAANKLATHMTIDDYEVSEFDIDCLVRHSALIALILQKCLGNDVYEHDYMDVEQASYEASCSLFGVNHSEDFIFNQTETRIKSLLID